MKSLRHLFTAVVVPVLLVVFVAGCSGSHKTKTLTSIAVTPATPANLKVGATQQFTATGTYSDSTTADITSSVTWASGTTATATISTGGLATGVAAGTTSITATQGSVVSPGVTLTVIALQSIAITPNPATIPTLPGTLQFTATGTYTDSSTANITTQVTWASATPAVATIGANTGLATGVSVGGSNITATLGSVVSPVVVLAVGGAVVPVSLKVSPVNPSIIVGNTADFTAVELMSDGSTQAVPGAITWTSGTPATAGILTNVGIATGKASGTSNITATFGALTGSSTLTVAAAVPRFVYTIGPNDGVTSSFAINTSANALAQIPSTVDPGTSLQLAFEPSGHFAYGAGVDGAIRIYSIDPTSGVLSPSGLSGIPGGGLPSFVPGSTIIEQSVIDPSGRFLYVIDNGTNFVNAFAINVDTTSPNYGNLTTIGSAVATGSFPFGAAITPNGKFLYVTDSDSAASSISGYQIDATNGSLTPITITASQLTTLNTPAVPAIDPTGQFLYVPNNSGASVTAFSINAATGDLTRIGTTDITTNLNTPFQAVTNPGGTSLFVTNSGSGTVAAFSIGATGALTATTIANSGGSANSIPEGIAIDPTGTFAAVANNGENTVTLFTLSGGIAAKYTTGSRIAPEFVEFYAGTASPVIGPSNVFAANRGSGNVSGFVANNATGVLGTAATATGQSGNSLLGADIAGKFLYSSSPGGPSIGGFSVTPSTAALAPVSAFALTTATDVPASIATEPTSRSLLVADTTGNLIETFSAGSSPVSSGTTAFTSVNDIVVDPQGTYVLALGSNSITVAQISGFTGTLICVNSVAPPCPAGFTQPGNWIAGAVDPTGHWVVALDGTGKALQPIGFVPAQNSIFASPDATLTAQGLPLGTGLAAPSSVTFDPLGRFVFVSDATNGKIAAFSFNEATGALTALGSPITVDATGTGKVSVDASGTYLYAAVKGNGGSVPSGVAAYKISSGGTLTAVAGSPFATGASTSGTADVVVTSTVQ